MEPDARLPGIGGLLPKTFVSARSLELPLGKRQLPFVCLQMPTMCQRLASLDNCVYSLLRFIPTLSLHCSLPVSGSYRVDW